MDCRFCNTKLEHVFVDLGMSPMANSYLTSQQLNRQESFYPLRTFVCSQCFLVQLEEFESPAHIFTDYAYFSSYSKTWLKHVEDFVALTIEKYQMNVNHQVIEIASNDGYLLQHFKKKNIEILGIEPASNVAKVAQKRGIPTVNEFFGESTSKKLASQGRQADLLIAFNVLPHVPNLNDFVSGLKLLLKHNGVLVIQFSAYLLELIQKNEFDAIYHEHFSYFSFLAIQRILAHHRLTIFDVEELSVHGGSLRLYIRHSENNESYPVKQGVKDLEQKEKLFGISDLDTYKNFPKKVRNVKFSLWSFFVEAKRENKKVVCYGAAAKGTTLLNYCGIGHDLVEYVADISPHKQNLYMPGTHIPIENPTKIYETKPDYLLILAWNFKDEIISQMNCIREWGGKFVIPIPEVEIIS